VCDDKIDIKTEIKWMNWEPFRFLESKPEIIVRMPCGHEILMKPNDCLTTTDCEQCKSQQMNPKVTLQENGDVIISNTVSNPTDKGFTITTTTTLSKVTFDEICRLVKEDKAKLEIRKWYRAVCIDGSENKALFYVTEIKGNIFYAYGFNYSGNWRNNWRSNCYFGITNPSEIRYEIASPETVEQYLREEAVKRGFNGKLKFKPIGSHLEVIRDGNENTFGFNESSNQLLYCNYVIFRDGQWATIINPKTITKAEAEKELGKVITD